MGSFFHDATFSPMGGVRIIEDRNMRDVVPDWSGCRSPSRAKRRHRQGKRTRMVLRYVPWEHAFRLPDGSVAMHPDMARKLRARLKDKEA